MSRAQAEVFPLGLVLIIAVVVGAIVVVETGGVDNDDLCQSERGAGWEYVEEMEDDGFYCEAPNGSVHLTQVNFGGPPTFDYWGLAAIIGFVLVLGGAIRYGGSGGDRR